MTKARPYKGTQEQVSPMPERKNSDRDAVNIDRREWMGSILPAVGEGLVKLLRASNNLKRDLHESLHARGFEVIQKESSDQKTKD